MRIISLQRHLGAYLLLLVLSGLPLAAGPIVITDNFDDNTLNPSLWSVIAPSGVSVSETGQRLEISATGPPDVFGGVALRGLVLGNFDLQLDYAMLTNIDGFGHEGNNSGAGLAWLMATGSFFLRGLTELPGGGSTGCYAAQIDAALSEGCYAQTTEQSGKFRITRVGSVYSLSYWSSGNWVLLAPSVSSTQTGPVDFYIATAVDGSHTVSAAFDNFYLQADAFVPGVPEPGSFALTGIAFGLICGIGSLRFRRKA